MNSEQQIRLGHLYPGLMNVYGDRGNVICLQRRARKRGIDLLVTPLEAGQSFEPGDYDIFFIGGAQDREQRLVADDLVKLKAAPLREAVQDGAVLLAVCGGYQLAGHFYRGAEGEELAGAAIFDMQTVHPGPTARRLIGNLVATWQEGTLVGFENHGGRTYLGAGVEPLARVISGYGNDGSSGFEGAHFRNAFGTYLHGPLLPKNPAFADFLLALALQRHGGDTTLQPLDDKAERDAHSEALRLSLHERRGLAKLLSR